MLDDLRTEGDGRCIPKATLVGLADSCSESFDDVCVHLVGSLVLSTERSSYDVVRISYAKRHAMLPFSESD